MINDKQFFPTLHNNKNLAYFDNAASTQTHQFVLDAMHKYYSHFRSNIGEHGDNPLSVQSSDAVELATEQVANFINVSTDEIIFTNGTTQGLNMIANWARSYDYVLICESDHNANISPWVAQGRTQENGKLIVLPVDDFNGLIDLSYLENQLQQLDGTCIISICATSNVTGVTQPWETIADLGHKYGASIAMDFCQTAPHHKIDLTVNPVEWAVFSGHKMFGPTGIGVLHTPFKKYNLPPLYFGGGAVNVTFNSITPSHTTSKYMPGTPNIAGIIGLGMACEMLTYYGMDNVRNDEKQVYDWLLSYGIDVIPNSKLIPCHRGSGNNIFTLVPISGHSQDISMLLSTKDVAVRCGRLCAHPYVSKISSKGVVRVSFSPYNTKKDCKKLVEELNIAFAKVKT